MSRARPLKIWSKRIISQNWRPGSRAGCKLELTSWKQSEQPTFGRMLTEINCSFLVCAAGGPVGAACGEVVNGVSTTSVSGWVSKPAGRNKQELIKNNDE